MSTDYSYIIQAVICDMLYKKGGMDLIKPFETPNDKALFDNIERLLGLKRKQVSQAFRKYLEEKY